MATRMPQRTRHDEPWPTSDMGKGIKSNVYLGVGDSGADEGLPVYRDETGFTSAWKLTLRQRLRVLFSGKVWLHILGFGHPPVCILTKFPPDLRREVAGRDKT